MTPDEKVTDLVGFSSTLSPRRRIILSDEGNLGSKDDFGEDDQRTFAYEKPTGLWYSFGSKWVDYLRDQETWGRKKLLEASHVYSFAVDLSAIFVIDSQERFDLLERGFANKGRTAVDWRKLAKYVDGIEIRHTRGFSGGSSPWYARWDVSSGCVWGKAAVRRFALLASWESCWRRSVRSSLPAATRSTAA